MTENRRQIRPGRSQLMKPVIRGMWNVWRPVSLLIDLLEGVLWPSAKVPVALVVVERR